MLYVGGGEQPSRARPHRAHHRLSSAYSQDVRLDPAHALIRTSLGRAARFVGSRGGDALCRIEPEVDPDVLGLDVCRAQRAFDPPEDDLVDPLHDRECP